jgi:Fe-S-cluster containining protein
MKKLLKYTDKMIDIFKQFSPCKKGCSNCCYIDVAVSNTEISLIEKFINKKKWNTRIKRNENTIKTIFVREIESGKKFGELSYGKKCPFLRNNECCVYCVRPYFCRKYIIFEKDNKKCGYNNENAYLLNSPITEEVYKKIIKYDTNRDYIPDFNQELFEIRDVFNEGN